MRTRARARSLLTALALALAFALPGGPVVANGWEHWGIPLDVLLKSLEGEDPGYRLRAARSLGVRRERSAVPRLLDMLASREEPAWVRAEAIRALGEIGDPRAVDGLVTVLRENIREELRGPAATALGRLGGPSARDALLGALGSEPTLLVRADIVTALGAFADPAVVDALAGLLADPSARGLHGRAIRSLGNTGSRRATPALLAALAAPGSDRTRALVVEALGRIADPAARTSLESLFNTTGDPGLKVRITVALGAIQDGSAVPKLIALLDNEIAAVQFFAVEALGAAGADAAAEPLRALYRRSAAAGGAPDAAADRPEIVRHLAQLSLQVAVVRALTAIDPRGSLAVFLEAARPRAVTRASAVGLRLNEGLYELRRAAIVGLGYSGRDEAVDTLVGDGFLTQRDFRLRAASLRALGVLRRAHTAIAVRPLLRDPVAEVRWVAAKVLGRLGDAQAGGDLVAALQDAHPEVRRQAILSLGYLQVAAACPALAGLVREDRADDVREAAQATRAHLCRSP